MESVTNCGKTLFIVLGAQVDANQSDAFARAIPNRSVTANESSPAIAIRLNVGCRLTVVDRRKELSLSLRILLHDVRLLFESIAVFVSWRRRIQHEVNLALLLNDCVNERNLFVGILEPG